MFASLLTLAACGGDGSSSSDEKNDSSIAEVESFDDLVHCTKSHFGEVRRVLEIDSIYQCTADGWVAIDSSEISNSSSSLAKSSSSIKASASETEKIEKKKVESVSLSGFAQIGSFASETSVSVYGLDASLATIKTKFSGKTSGDSGRFEISGISFDNQYAQVEVSGYFMNMLTGKTTSGTRSKLHAIVDLSESKNVKANVNLFTEMEQARVNNLVLNEKFNVPAAKVRATKEILKLFDVKAPDGLTSTAVSLADTGKVGAALYATMVMMQADLSISKFNSRFDDFVEDFAEDGSFDDAELRAAIADYLSGIDDGFSAIRSSMERVVKKVPNFEKLLVNFWTSELGLGECTDSLETSIVKVSNKNSSLYHKGFACTSRRWHLSTELDTEFGLCTAKMEGEFKESKLDEKTKYYACTNGEWKEISKTAYELKSCTDDNFGEVLKGYACDEGAVANDWRPATTFEKLASFVCSSETAGSDRIFNSARDTVFVCGSNDEWEMLSGSFTDTRDSKKYKTIKIGTQTWMAENLRYADSSKTTNLKGRTRCFNDVKSNCDTYGPLYTYSAAMNIDKTYDTYNVSVASVVKAKHQGICPTGWHIPSVAEYETLINYVQSVAGVDSLGKNFISVSGWKYAKAVSGWHLYDMAGWDSFGFNLLQAGFGTKDGSGYDYYPLQNSDQGSSMLWASDEYAGTKDVSYEAYLLKVQTDKTGNVSVQTDFWPKDGIHSVRCIKN